MIADKTEGADYILACGSVKSLPVTADVLRDDRPPDFGTVACGVCQVDCQVIERVNAEDLGHDANEVTS